MTGSPTARTIAVASFDRAEFSACRAVLLAAVRDPRLAPRFIAGGGLLTELGAHLVHSLEAEGVAPSERIPWRSGDAPCDTVAAIAAVATGMGEALRRLSPDILVLVGDRSELLGAAGAATASAVPLAHISGGEITEGAYDDAVRHALTKLSHVHFVAMEDARRRLQQLGEEDWRITVTGDPSLDTFLSARRLSREELSKVIGQELSPPVVVLTWHPATLGGDPGIEVEELIKGLAAYPGTLVITAANADPGGGTINRRMRELAAERPRTGFHTALGPRLFSSLLAIADGMVGNSSSGIWEAPSYLLPVLNVGDRQSGRCHARNVVHTPCVARDISAGLGSVLNPAFRAGLLGMTNPYGDGHAAERIVEILTGLPSRKLLLRKRFVNYSPKLP